MEEASLLYLLGKEKCCMPPTHTLHPSSPPSNAQFEAENPSRTLGCTHERVPVKGLPLRKMGQAP